MAASPSKRSACPLLRPLVLFYRNIDKDDAGDRTVYRSSSNRPNPSGEVVQLCQTHGPTSGSQTTAHRAPKRAVNPALAVWEAPATTLEAQEAAWRLPGSQRSCGFAAVRRHAQTRIRARVQLKLTLSAVSLLISHVPRAERNVLYSGGHPERQVVRQLCRALRTSEKCGGTGRQVPWALLTPPAGASLCFTPSSCISCGPPGTAPSTHAR